MRKMLVPLALAAALAGTLLVPHAASAQSAETTAAPPENKSSPPTNLKDYPKLPVPSARPPTVAPKGPGVASVVEQADGTVTATLYDPAPGVTDQELYEDLKRSGVVGLQDPAAPTVTPFSAGLCSWGTATTAACPQVHWANNGYSHPQVYFADHTSSEWPVTAATYKWNQAQGIDSGYVWARCPGYRGTHCVHVYDGNYGVTRWVGRTFLVWDRNRNFIDGSILIQLNDYHNPKVNPAGHRQAVCHEMGHALGMGHDSARSSCLYGSILSSTSAMYPNSYDFALIANIYSVRH